jgi:hypothetical protein
MSESETYKTGKICDKTKFIKYKRNVKKETYKIEDKVWEPEIYKTQSRSMNVQIIVKLKYQPAAAPALTLVSCLLFRTKYFPWHLFNLL